MFDIEKELCEIRSIKASPSKKLVRDTQKLVEKTLKEKKLEKRKNMLKFTGLASLPAVAAALLTIVIMIGISRPAAYYNIELETSITIESNERGEVTKISYGESESFEDVNKELAGQSVEYAISSIISSADKTGYIGKNQNILIACFGDDEYNNISKNLILSFLDDDIKNNINLMSISSSINDWKNATKLKISPSIYALSLLSENTSIDKTTSLDDIITSIENTEKMTISDFLKINAEPIIYKSPEIEYSINGEYVVFSWDYIDYKKSNYDGHITYQLVSSDSKTTLTTKPTIEDMYNFTVWKKQPTDYTMLYNENTKDKYYAIIAVYDDGTKAMNESFIYLP